VAETEVAEADVTGKLEELKILYTLYKRNLYYHIIKILPYLFM